MPSSSLARGCCGRVAVARLSRAIPSVGQPHHVAAFTQGRLSQGDIKALPSVHRRRLSLSSSAAEYLAKSAKNVVIDSLCEETSSDSNTWICNSEVDRPTISILEPNFKQIRSTKSTRTDSAGNAFQDPGVDPFELVAGEIVSLADTIKTLLGTDHPVLSSVAKYMFEMDGGKKVRPTMVLLVAGAARADGVSLSPEKKQLAIDSQRRLAEITEMIHTASLFHDDVIDMAETRRGFSSVNEMFGNKMAILAGDFLLSRASVLLARLRNVEVVELLSSVIEHLVKGEIMQIKGTSVRNPNFDGFEYYLRKNYYKTGSLMANSCRAAALLGGHSEEYQELAFSYGKHFGLAFQLVDDVLDIKGNPETMGKAKTADMKQGLATAPVLFAAEEYPGLNSIIERKFDNPGDVEEALRMIEQSKGVDKAMQLAVEQAMLAVEVAMNFEPSPYRDALVSLAFKVVNRDK